jgi:biofilm protein TabA
MIFGSLNHTSTAETAHPLFKQAFDFIRAANIQALFADPAKIELAGRDLYLFGSEYQGKTREQARIEAHRRYIDIQIPVEGIEEMGWVDIRDCGEVVTPYNPDKDVEFYVGPVSTWFAVAPGQFAIFFPEDVHQPGVGQGTLKKIVVKVLL